ncbi:MAG: FMN-dependent NADH-azoreductase [Chlamydiales bacterium]|nr:FMN-dependent NADH-azoreductase [Chlamydiales bacterium]
MTVLYITAHPLDETESESRRVGKAFIDAYRLFNPSHSIVHLDLFKEHIPFLDADVFYGRKKRQLGQSDLSEPQKAKLERLAAIADQFAAADKYVFVTPMWNFSFPPLLKAYIDAICAAGKTFQYTPSGVKGLLQGKRALHIQASGDIYSEGSNALIEIGYRHLEAVMHFLGVQDVQKLFIEGHKKFPHQAEEIIGKALLKAKQMAEAF